MLKFRYLAFVVLSLFCTQVFAKQSKNKPYDAVVSLGNMCQVAHQLDINNKRGPAYPLDWVIVPFPSLCFFIANEGQLFLQPDQLVLCENQVDGQGNGNVQTFIKDLYYQIEFVHDFEYTHDFLKDYATIKEKYDRRVERFFELLNSKKKVLLVRRGINYQQAVLLDELLKQKYPKLNYTILALDNTEEIKQNWGLKRVKNYHLRELTPWNWVGDPWAWQEILSQFPIKKVKPIKKK